MKNEKQIDAVRLMREIRERIGRELEGKTFEQQKRYIEENVPQARRPERTNAA